MLEKFYYNLFYPNTSKLTGKIYYQDLLIGYADFMKLSHNYFHLLNKAYFKKEILSKKFYNFNPEYFIDEKLKIKFNEGCYRFIYDNITCISFNKVFESKTYYIYKDFGIKLNELPQMKI